MGYLAASRNAVRTRSTSSATGIPSGLTSACPSHSRIWRAA